MTNDSVADEALQSILNNSRSLAGLSGHRGYKYQTLIALRWCLHSVIPLDDGRVLERIVTEVGEDFTAIWRSNNGKRSTVQWVQVKSSEDFLHPKAMADLLWEMFENQKDLPLKRQADIITLASPVGYPTNYAAEIYAAYLLIHTSSGKIQVAGRSRPDSVSAYLHNKSLDASKTRQIKVKLESFLRKLEIITTWPYSVVRPITTALLFDAIRNNGQKLSELSSSLDRLLQELDDKFSEPQESLVQAPLPGKRLSKKQLGELELARRTLVGARVNELFPGVSSQASTAGSAVDPSHRTALRVAAVELHAAVYETALLIKHPDPYSWAGLTHWRNTRSNSILPDGYFLRVLVATQTLVDMAKMQPVSALVDQLREAERLSNDHMDHVSEKASEVYHTVMGAQARVQDAKSKKKTAKEIKVFEASYASKKPGLRFSVDLAGLYFDVFDEKVEEVRSLLTLLTAPDQQI